MKKEIGVIFDCDGTLIDSEAAHFLSWQHACRKRGSELSLEEYCLFTGQPSLYVSQKLHQKIGVDSADKLLEDKRKKYHELHREGLAPIERTVHFVKKLVEKKEELGIRLGVASAARKEEILINLDCIGLGDVFEVILSGQDDLQRYVDPEGVNKPKPYIYLEAALRLGLHPAQCIAFEDSLPGILAALGAGFKAIAVPNSFTKGHDFSLAHHLIHENDPISLHLVV